MQSGEATTSPGRHYRKGITLKQFLRVFPDDAGAEAWFIRQRWPKGMCCPVCGTLNVRTGCKHKTMPFLCREKPCGKKFSAKHGTVMEGSKIAYQDWILALFLASTSLKGVSSMKLHRDLGVTQETAWFLAMRIRAALSQDDRPFAGPVEADETYLGGKRKNMGKAKRKELTGRGPAGKTAVAGAKDRATYAVASKVVQSTDRATLQGFIKDHAVEGVTVYTDDAKALGDANRSVSGSLPAPKRYRRQ